MMSSETLAKLVREEFDNCSEFLGLKAGEYASSEDRLHNFRTAAGLSGKSMKECLAGMMIKHTVSVYDMAYSSKEFELDKWKEKITDHINYLLLLWAMVSEESQE